MENPQPDNIFDLFFKNSLDLLCIADLNGRFVKLNPEWANTLGYELSFLEGKAFIDFVHPDDKDETLRATRELASSQLITSFVNRYQCIDGSYRWIEWRSYPYNGLIYASARDITERKKNELKLIQSENRLNSIINIMQHDAKNEQQLLDYALDEAIRLTHSTIGYIYHYKEDTQEFILNSWSKSVMEECKIKDPKTCYALANTGIWGEAVRQRKPILINDFSSENQLKKGYPPGHVELSNFLTIPVFKGDLIIAVVGVGNKLTDYEEADILQLKLLMDATIKVLDKIRAEEALRKSENRYRLLFENMTSAFALHQMIYDENQTPIDYSYIEANPAFERLTGVPINTLIGKNVLSLLPDLEDHWIKTFGNVAKTGEPIRYINYVVDLQKYFDTYSFSPEKDQFAVVFNDITEQVKAEQALKESENRFRGMVENMPIALGVADLNGNIKYVNKMFVDLFGYQLDDISTIEEWMNKAYPDKEYRDKVFKIWQEDIFHVLKTDNSHSSKRLYTITAKSGVLVDAELSFTIIDDEIYVIFDDVSQKIKAEKDLKTSEQKFENIFNMSPDMVGITLQANGRIVAGNPQFTTLTGYTYNEFIGATTIELGLWADPEDRNRMMKMLLRDGKVDNQVFGMRIKDGSVLTCLFSAQAIQFDGEPCLIFVVHDITERIKNEEKIKINEARLIRAQAVGHIGYSEQIIGDDMVWASAEAKSIYGLDPVDGFVKIDQIKQATIDLDYFIKSVANMVQKGSKMDIQYAIKPFNQNEIKYVHAVSELEYDASGKPYKILSVFQDVTEKKRADNALLESERNYRDIFNTTSDALFIHEISTGDILDVNESMLKMYGYKGKEEIMHMTIADFSANLDDYSVEKLRLKFTKAIDEGPQVFEWLAKHKSGKLFWTEVSLSLTVIGGENRMIASVRDITPRKEAQEKDQRLKNIFAAAPVAIGVINDDIFEECNEMISPLTGYSASEMFGKNILEITPKAEYDRINSEISQHNFEHGVYRTETVWFSKDGEKREILLQIIPGKANNRSKHGMFTALDITDRKHAELEIMRLNDELEERVKERTLQLEQVNKDLESFAYSVSHDLRAPLRHIDGFAKLMYSQIKEPNENITNYYHKTTQASKRLSVMIDELLSFSRLGRKHLSLNNVDLNEIVKEAIANLKPDWINRQIDWKIGMLPTVKSDKALMLIVFDNLISNAIKYTSKKDTATIEIGSIANEDEKNMHQIFVKDNGAGFDMAYAGKLFGVFQRLHTNEEFEGTGIGLANVKQIINKHNGLISVESEINKGATFYISLPKIG